MSSNRKVPGSTIPVSRDERENSESTKLSKLPRMEGNISHLWGSDGTVLAGDMLGKAVRSIFEQKSTLVNVTNSTVSIHETFDTKVNVTVSADEETEVEQNVYPKSHKQF